MQKPALLQVKAIPTEAYRPNHRRGGSYCLERGGRVCVDPQSRVSQESEITMKRKSTPKLVTDPVCDMEFSADKAVATLKFNHQTYYFCSAACLKLFEADPLAYVDKTQTEEPAPS